MALRSLTRRPYVKYFHLLLPLTLPPSNACPTVPPHHLFQAFHPIVPLPSRSLVSSFSYLSAPRPFTAEALEHPIDDFSDDAFHFHNDPQDPVLLQFLELLRKFAHFSSEAEATASLDESGIQANRDLVGSAIRALREEYKAAFLAFRWGEKWNCNDEEVYHLMIWVLGNHGKFSTAWCLIRDMLRSSLCTRRAMLIMIDR